MAELLDSFLCSHIQEEVCCRKSVWAHREGLASQAQSAYFLPEFALSPQGSFLEDTTGEQYLTYRYDDQVKASKVNATGPSAAACVLCLSIIRLPCQKEGGYHPGLCLLRFATDGGLSPTDTGLKLIDNAHVPFGHLPGQPNRLTDRPIV
ncbi:ADAMTS-like protein 3 [Anabarilius grahami]|uniref:ADAMTS-like protein 3 n=1 Tax=Anabarilius grahami TaxID=495550 RepID=A0A3N0XM29_ANAGA|nr:ADAMTS-like protein 3 [Anabarilius grahami]